jgi:hypothetical protein
MTDTLLFLHLLSAASLFAGVVAYSAVVLGADVEPATMRIFTTLSRVGLVGVLVFGLALAIDLDAYHPWDGWVLIAIVLWLGAGGTGDRVAAAYRESGGEWASVPRDIARTHWIHVALVVLLLADMIWKPWA